MDSDGLDGDKESAWVAVRCVRRHPLILPSWRQQLLATCPRPDLCQDSQAAVNSNFCKSYMCRNCNGQIRDARDHLLHLICEPLSLILVDDDDDDDDSEDLCGPHMIQSDHSGF